MPALEHEFPLDLIRYSPELVASLLSHASDQPLPAYTNVRCESGDATTTAPPELRADSVVVLERRTGPRRTERKTTDKKKPKARSKADGADENTVEPVLAVVTECQNGKDADKRFSWPAYVANLRARLRCPVVLLVLAPDDALARWCAAPIDLGGGYLTHRPLVLALTDLEPVTDPEEARAEPELAILTATVHHSSDPTVLDALLPAFDALDASTTNLYSDYVLAALPAAARKYLEDSVNSGTYKFKSDFVGRPFRQGKAEAVLTVLDARGIKVDDAARERITSCADADQLDVWVRRAVTVVDADDLFV